MEITYYRHEKRKELWIPHPSESWPVEAYFDLANSIGKINGIRRKALPEPLIRLLRRAGVTFREVPNPNLTAKGNGPIALNPAPKARQVHPSPLPKSDNHQPIPMGFRPDPIRS